MNCSTQCSTALPDLEIAAELTDGVDEGVPVFGVAKVDGDAGGAGLLLVKLDVDGIGLENLAHRGQFGELAGCGLWLAVEGLALAVASAAVGLIYTIAGSE